MEVEGDNAAPVQEDGAAAGDAAVSLVGAVAEQVAQPTLVHWATMDAKTTSKH